MIKRLAFSVTISCALCALIYAGPEQFSGKEMKQAVEPLAAVQWYADNEWNVSIWGTYVFTANGGEEALQQAIPWSSDRYLGTDDAWGGGIDLKYFFHRYFGVGIEGYGLAVHREPPQVSNIIFGTDGTEVTLHDEDRFVGAVLSTFTLRYPIGRVAPYIFAGVGGIFGGGDVQHIEFTGTEGNGTDYFEVYRGGASTELLGQFGVGLEVRCTRHIGVMADFSWNVVDGPQNNFGMARSGLTFAF